MPGPRSEPCFRESFRSEQGREYLLWAGLEKVATLKTYFSTRPSIDCVGKAASHLIAFEEKTGCSFLLCLRKNSSMRLLLCKETLEFPLEMEKFRTIRPPKGKATLPVGLEYYNVDWLFLGPG